MRRKGFTLIELLAVIVILAIIALIATPMIMNVIEKARRGAALGSANSYLHSVEMYLTLQDINEYSEKLESNKVYSIYETTELYEGTEEIDSNLILSDYIDVKGDYPIDGYVEIGANKIKEAIFNINGYRIECDNQLICEVTNKISTEIVEAESVTIEVPENRKLEVGEEMQLKTTILPKGTTERKIKWTSSDESVVTVSNRGMIKVVGKGIATITAETTNHKVHTVEIVTENLSLFNGEEIQFAKTREVPDATGLHNIITVADETITMQCNTGASGWGASSLEFYDFQKDLSLYHKLVIEAAWQTGHDYAIEAHYKDGTEIIICSSAGASTDLYPIGRVSFDRTRFELDLTDKSPLEKIVFVNSSLNAKFTIYDIHFE